MVEKETIVDTPEVPAIGSRWMRGAAHDPDKGPRNGYTVVEVANTASLSDRYPKQVIYRGDNGNVWTKLLTDWPGSLVPEKPVGRAYEKSTTNLVQEVRRLRDALEEISGCFKAAHIEGLSEALVETTDAHLKDLIERRILHAGREATKAITTTATIADEPAQPVAMQITAPDGFKTILEYTVTGVKAFNSIGHKVRLLGFIENAPAIDAQKATP